MNKIPRFLRSKLNAESKAKRASKRDTITSSYIVSGNTKDEFAKENKVKKHHGKWKEVSPLPLNRSAVARHAYLKRKANAPSKVTWTCPVRY